MIRTRKNEDGNQKSSRRRGYMYPDARNIVDTIVAEGEGKEQGGEG